MTFTCRMIDATGPLTGLAVFVHGWASTSHDLEEVIEVVRETLPGLDCAVIDHEASNPLSNIRPEVLADRIAYEIERLTRDCLAKTGRRYPRIVLIGHSVGALLLKKAYVFACGSLEDSLASERYQWPAEVDQLISLAGIDRGIALLEKSDRTPLLMFLLRRAAYNIARFTHTAAFLRALQRGNPFVSNLRVQWLRLRTNTGSNVTQYPMPTVNHLVGDRDDLIERNDSVDDLLRSQSYIYQSVIDATHKTIVQPSKNGYVRRELVAALTRNISSIQERLKPRTTSAGGEIERKPMTDIFYVIHGIRDLGRTWTPGMCDAIKLAAGADRTKTVRTVRSSYGYFSMLSFLISFDRQKNVRWFMDLYTQMLARYPKANHHYVGHSNGTYILASALERYATCRVRNVVFAGSVVRSAFDWTKFHERDQVAYVRNDAASADWVVAIFPHLFEFIADIASSFDVNAPKWCDLGGAGFYGFFDDLSNDNTWLPGQHGAALVSSNHSSIAESVVFGRSCPPVPAVTAQNPRIVLLSKFAWLLVSATLCAVLAVTVAGVWALAIHGWFIAAALCVVLFLIVLFGVMYTI